MSTAYFQRALHLYSESRAAVLGCVPDDFDRHELVIVAKPADSKQKFLLMALTLGTGTVVSVRDDYLDWTKANAPADKHYRALFPNVLLAPLAEEAARRGESVGWRAPNLSFLPGNQPAAKPVPGGLAAMPFERAWRDRVFPTGEFHNALGELDDDDGDDFRYGLAIMDGDRPAAVAGGWDDGEGLIEIGVDVSRDYRGRGLGEVVVTNLAAHIAERGAVPTYYCAPTNVRSHRNAIGSGFVPVASASRAAPTS